MILCGFSLQVRCVEACNKVEDMGQIMESGYWKLVLGGELDHTRSDRGLGAGRRAGKVCAGLTSLGLPAQVPCIQSCAPLPALCLIRAKRRGAEQGRCDEGCLI